MSDKVREGFEAWHRSVVVGAPPHDKYGNGDYINQHVQRYWVGWRESRTVAVVDWPDQHTYTAPDVAGAAILDCRTAFGKAGFQTPETASAFRALLAERNSLAFLLKRFVDGEHDHDENQAERHMYHDEAQALLAYLGGELHGHTLVPDESLRRQSDENERLQTLAQTEIDKACESAKEVMGARMTLYAIDQDLNRLKSALTTLRHHDRVTADQVQIIDAALTCMAATQSTDNEDVSRHEER